MSPIVGLILSKILDYLADHADEIVQAIKDNFPGAEQDPEMKNAILDLGYAPTEEALTKLHNIMIKKNHDIDKLAGILVSKTVV